jgi:biotin operon repressor
VSDARRLHRLQKWSYQHIADHLQGIGRIDATIPAPAAYRRVYKALNYERVRKTDNKFRGKHTAEESARQKRYRAETAPNCVRCAARLSKPPKVLPPVCYKCRREEGARNKAAIGGLALAGHSAREIAQLLNLNEGSIHTCISVLRQEGMPIPFSRLPRTLANRQLYAKQRERELDEAEARTADRAGDLPDDDRDLVGENEHRRSAEPAPRRVA